MNSWTCAKPYYSSREFAIICIFADEFAPCPPGSGHPTDARRCQAAADEAREASASSSARRILERMHSPPPRPRSALGHESDTPHARTGAHTLLSPQKKILGPLQRLCSACGQIRPLGWFSRNGQKGRRAQCRDCMRGKRSVDAARRRGAGAGKVPPGIWARLYARQVGCCGVCGGLLGGVRRIIHVDHRVPLARGGEHHEQNLQLTHARCNLLKGAKLTLRTSHRPG